MTDSADCELCGAPARVLHALDADLEVVTCHTHTTHVDETHVVARRLLEPVDDDLDDYPADFDTAADLR